MAAKPEWPIATSYEVMLYYTQRATLHKELRWINFYENINHPRHTWQTGYSRSDNFRNVSFKSTLGSFVGTRNPVNFSFFVIRWLSEENTNIRSLLIRAYTCLCNSNELEKRRGIKVRIVVQSYRIDVLRARRQWHCTENNRGRNLIKNRKKKWKIDYPIKSKTIEPRLMHVLYNLRYYFRYPGSTSGTVPNRCWFICRIR